METPSLKHRLSQMSNCLLSPKIKLLNPPYYYPTQAELLSSSNSILIPLTFSNSPLMENSNLRQIIFTHFLFIKITQN